MAPNRQKRAKAKPTIKQPKPVLKRPKPKKLNCPFKEFSNCDYKGHIDGKVFRLHLWQHYKEVWKRRVEFLVSREDNLYSVYCDECPHESTGVTPDGAKAVATCHLALCHNELRFALKKDERLSEDFVNDVYYDVDLQEAKRNPSGLPMALPADLYLQSQIYPKSECVRILDFEFRMLVLAVKQYSRLVPCSNKKNGCQETFKNLKIDVIAKHEEDCRYRLVPCLNNGNGCKEKVIFDNVIQHFEDMHARYTGVPLQHQASLRIVPNKKKMLSHALQNAMIYFDSNAFIIKSRMMNSRRYFWVYLLGSPNEAKNFSFTLIFYGSALMTYAGPVASIDETFDNIYDSANCFSFDEIEFDVQFQQEDGKYEYSLTIRKDKFI